MNRHITKAALGIALAATTLTVAAPADAQRWRRHNRGGDVATGALVGGLLGLGVGAAIASSNRDRYWDRGYYGPPRRFRGGPGFYGPPRGYGWGGAPGYGWGGGYYAPPPPPPVYVAPVPPYGYGGYGW